jgi:hypothetical protein
MTRPDETDILDVENQIELTNDNEPAIPRVVLMTKTSENQNPSILSRGITAVNRRITAVDRRLFEVSSWFTGFMRQRFPNFDLPLFGQAGTVVTSVFSFGVGPAFLGDSTLLGVFLITVPPVFAGFNYAITNFGSDERRQVMYAESEAIGNIEKSLMLQLFDENTVLPPEEFMDGLSSMDLSTNEWIR